MGAHQFRLNELQIKPIDTASAIPFYYQIEENLRALLNSESMSPGDLLPTELELAEAYGVGRHTIRTALSRLVNDNLIVRKAGHGTVVKGHEDRREFSLARSFTHQMARSGLRATSVVKHKEARQIHADDPPALSGKFGAHCLILDRLRLGNGEPIGLQRAYVVLEHCSGLERIDFNCHSLYEALSNQYQLFITEITDYVSAASADEQQSALLRIAPGAPLLVVHTNAFLDGGEIIECSVTYYRADKYAFTTTQTLP